MERGEGGGGEVERKLIKGAAKETVLLLHNYNYYEERSCSVITSPSNTCHAYHSTIHG